MKQNPLISIILLSYKNYQYIYEALDSILCQNYPNIEIIISNDGSDDFDEIAIKEYLEKYKKQNIKKIIINNNEKNIGTVKNINKAIILSKGEYIIMFAADDAMHDNEVITKLINAFKKLPKEELIVISQVGMYDIKLKKLIQLFLSNEDIDRIKNLEPQELFAEMSTRCIVPGCGTCYKRKIFEKYDFFDEKYVLVEDFSYALKLSRLGVKHNYFDFISVKHRDGGISHGNVNGEIKTSKQYDLDILNIIKNEVLPFLDLLNKKQKKIFIKKYKNIEWKFKYKYNYINVDKKEKRKYIFENLNTILSCFFGDFYREVIDQLIGKKAKILLIGAILFTFYCFFDNYKKGLINLFSLSTMFSVSKFIGIIGILLIISSIILIIHNFIKKFLYRIIRFIKFIL